MCVSLPLSCGWFSLYYINLIDKAAAGFEKTDSRFGISSVVCNVLSISMSCYREIVGGRANRCIRLHCCLVRNCCSFHISMHYFTHLYFYVMETVSFLKPREPTSPSSKFSSVSPHISQPSKNRRELRPCSRLDFGLTGCCVWFDYPHH